MEAYSAFGSYIVDGHCSGVAVKRGSTVFARGSYLGT